MERDSKRKPSDGELLRRFLADDPHDPDAFRLIFDRYEAPVKRYLMGYFKLDHRAEDVGQETFLRLLNRVEQHPGVWPEDESIEPLIMFIAARAAVDSLRAEGRLRRMDTKFAIFSADEASWKESAASISAIGIDVQRALAALPPSLREVAELYFLEDFIGAEVAEMTHSSLDAAKKQIGRARRRLQIHLKLERS